MNFLETLNFLTKKILILMMLSKSMGTQPPYYTQRMAFVKIILNFTKIKRPRSWVNNKSNKYEM